MRAHAWLDAPTPVTGSLTATAAALLGVLTIVVLWPLELGLTTHAGASGSAGVVSATAGLALLGAGIVTAVLLPHDRTAAVIASLAGLAWFSSDWIGWEGGPPLVRSVGMVVEPFFLPLVLHLVVAAPTAGGGLRRIRAVRAVYLMTAVVSVGRALFRDPFLDRYCWSNCRDNVFLLTAQPDLARLLEALRLVTALVVAALLATWSVRGIRSPGRRRAARLWPALGPSFVLGGATCVHVLLLRVSPPESAQGAYAAVFQVRAWATAGLAVGVVIVVTRAWRSRVALARLASDLGGAPVAGSLQHALARATSDPTLEVVYALNGGTRYVDATGRHVPPPAGASNQAATPIVRDGREIAVIVHDAARVDAAQLRVEMGAAARLSIENERLRAELLAQLRDLRWSRARVVEAGDSERRRLERNLHDGAQQRLLALLYEVRAVRRQFDAVGGDVGELLQRMEREVAAAIDALRELAHGIYPAILTESGLEAALWSLTDAAPVPVEILAVPGERLPEPVERTAYVMAVEAVEAAHRLQASHLEVAMRRRSEHLVVEVDGAGNGPFVHLEDRVGALAGRLTIEAGRLRAEIPCA
jgi:signal transduction histidine kinase